MSVNRFGLSAVVLTCASVLSACGGGGGGGDSSAGVPPMSSPMLAINASNYQAVGQATVSSTLYLGNTGGVLTGAQSSADPRLLRHAVDVSRRALAVAAGRQALLGGAEIRDTAACSQGGSLAISINDANNNGNFDVGDTLTVDAQSCKEAGAVMQGRIALGMQALTGTYGSSSYSATMSMSLTAFSVVSGNDQAQGDGTMTLSISQTASGVGDLTLATPRLVLSGRTAGQSYSTTLVDTRLTVHIEPILGGERTTTTYASSLTSSSFDNKQVTISTPQALVITGSDLYPSSGQLLVRGDAGSTLRITAVNATQVRLELDAGGDGNFETSVLKNWSELQ